MEVLNCHYVLKPGMREAFVETLLAEKIPQLCQAEDGNFRYAFCRPIDREDELYLVEQWRDDDAIQKHCATAHFKKLQEIERSHVDQFHMDRFTKEDE